MTDIRQQLTALADPAYKQFHTRLIPTVDPDTVLGVRTPALRAYAKQLQRTDPATAAAFLQQVPHRYYEENNLHLMLLALREKQIDALLAAIEDFLPWVDNWATCDTGVPKLFAKHPDRVRAAAACWLQSDHVYTVRFGIVTLLGFLRAGFDARHLQQVADANGTGEYYIDMAVAWYFSMALVHQWDAALPWLTGQRLTRWVHNKAIQKARESHQLSAGQKEYLKALRR